MSSKISTGHVVNRVSNMYGENFGVLVGTAAVLFIVVGIIRGLLIDAGGLLLLLLASIVLLLGTALYMGMVVRLVEDVTQDGRRDHTVGDLLGSVTPVLLPLIVAGIIFSIAVGIGFLLIIVPGVILLTIWAVFAPVIVVERAGVFDSFGRSYELVRGNFWPVLGAIVIIFLIAFVIGFIFAAIGTGIGDEWGSAVGSVIANVLTAPLTGLVAAILYFELRAVKEPAPAAGAPQTSPPPPPPPPPGPPAS